MHGFGFGFGFCLENNFPNGKGFKLVFVLFNLIIITIKTSLPSK
jgi:hypothetical protein